MPPVDPFGSLHPTASGRALGFVAVTPADADLPVQLRWLRVDGAGTLRASDPAGTTVTFTVAEGEVLQGPFARIWATGTTATGLVGWI